MSLPNFGIPNVEAKVQALDQVVSGNQEALYAVAMNAVQPLADTVSDNDALLGKVGQRFSKVLRGVVKANDKRLDSVGNTIASGLGSTVSNINSQLASISIADGHGPQVLEHEASLVPPHVQLFDVWEGCTTDYVPPEIGGGGGNEYSLCKIVPHGSPPPYSGLTKVLDGVSQIIAGQKCATFAPLACSVYKPPPPPPPPPPPQPPPTHCPPVPPCPPPPPPPPPVKIPELKCDSSCPFPQISALTEADIAIGSEKWCQSIDTLIDAAVQLGVILITWLSEELQSIPKDIAKDIADRIGFDESSPALLIPGLGSLQDAIRASILQAGDDVACKIASLFKCAQELASKLAPCNPNAYVLLVFLRSILELLHNVRVGTDFAVWLTVDYKLDLSEMKDLLDYYINAVCPLEIPSVADSIECYLNQTAPLEQVQCWMKARGANWDVWQPVVTARRDKLQTDELIQYLRRTDQDQDAQLAWLRKYGWLDQDEANARLVLYDRLPSIADHLHWTQRNVYDDQYVIDYELLTGFDERFWPKFGHDLTAIGMKKEYAQLHYAAHWINPAPGQLLEMVYRLRPDKQGVANPFTVADYQRILAEQDVGPYFQPRFAEIRYRVPALSYLRDMYRANQLSDGELQSYHKDLGYSEEDSQRFVQIDALQKVRMRTVAAHGWQPSAIAHGYVSGYLTADQVQQLMGRLGYTADESRDLQDRANADLAYTTFTRARGRVLFAVLSQVKSALEIGTITGQDAIGMLQGMGWSLDFASGWVSIQQGSANTKLIKQAIARIRNAFLSGEVDSQFVTQSLQSLGIAADALSRYVGLWQLEKTPSRKRRSASQITNDVANGELDTTDALVRLQNLGYEDADRRLYLADAQRKILQREQKLVQSQERTDRSKAKQLQQQIKETERQQKELIAELRRISPPRTLQKWAVLGKIGKDLFYARYRLFGYDEPDIDRYWQEACDKKGAVCAETVP